MVHEPVRPTPASGWMSRRLPAILVFGSLLLNAACSTDPALEWHEEETYRWAELPFDSGSRAGFDEMPPARTGVTFVNTLEEESLLKNRHYMNGSGVAVGDFDGDGWADIYFARLDGSNVLYRNLGGWRFEDVTEAAGVAAADRYSTGAVFADVNGDGHLDLLVTAMGGPNALFLNDGSGRFTDVTEQAGLSSTSGSTSMALADVDGDGDLDLYVANYKVRSVNDIYAPWEHSFEQTVERTGEGEYRIVPRFAQHYELLEHAGGLLRVERAEPNRFYLNDGTGRFERVPLSGGAFRDESGEALPGGPSGAGPEDWTLTVRFQDADGDGVPDLYVCNDFHSPDYFFHGDGRGGFDAVPPLSLRKTSFSTMSVDFSDTDRDSHLDFFLTDMLSRDHVRRQTQVGLTIPMPTAIGEIDNRPQVVQNTFFLNRGDGTYAETARMSGVAASDWTWSGLFLDVDLDGYEDLLLSTGHAYDVLNIDAQQREFLDGSPARDHEEIRRLLLDFPELPLENVAFRNRGDGTFHFKPKGWGLGRNADISHGMAFGDFDNDGYIDVVVNRLNETAGLFRNEGSAPRITIRLRGRAPNTQGIGAKIRVSGGGLPDQEKEVVSGGQYLSGSDPIYAFAASSSDSLLSIEIAWRSGAISRLDSIPANRMLEIDEPEMTDSSLPAPNGPASTDARRPLANGETSSEARPHHTASVGSTWFVDESEHLQHEHVDAAFSDFEKRPLLPRGLGRSGPGVAWIDFDGDGDDDLVIGTGRGDRIRTFRNDGGRLIETVGMAEMDEAPDDVTGLVALRKADGGATLFAALSNIERGAPDSSFILIFDISPDGRAVLEDRLPFGRHAIGPLALADIDGDGDLDLFAGGRSTHARFPEPAPSRIYLNEGGVFRLDAAAGAALENVGNVSGAFFGDMDSDGDPDLLLAVEWGSLRYYQNEDGRFVDRTDEVGLAIYSGLWNGVAPGDFDGDGRVDFVATNWGWNGIHERLHLADLPVRLYYFDFDANGMLDLVESYYDAELGGYVPLPGLALLSEAMPYIRQRMPSFDVFASSTLAQIIGPKIDRAPYLEAGTLTSMVFMNRSSEAGLKFEGAPLPQAAQLAPAFSAVVGDFDADGNEDIFLSQNFFDLPMDIPRQDAGRGLLLLGDGRGSFVTIPGHETGLIAYGEQRGAAISDIDGDGRIDLLVTQNGAATRLFRNTLDAGLRIRLHGPHENLSAIGTSLRLRYDDDSRGPVRLVTAGSGYMSQNSSTAVLGHVRDSRQPVAVHIRWPDGLESESVLPPGAGSIEVHYEEVDRITAE